MLYHPIQIITKRFNDPHSTIGIFNAQHIVDKIWRHWGVANIRKRTPVTHHKVCEVQALKTTRPTFFLKSQGPVRGGKAVLLERHEENTDRRNRAQGFPTPNNETLQLDTTIKGTHKPMQRIVVIAIDHKSVAMVPSLSVSHGARYNNLHTREHSLDIRRCKEVHFQIRGQERVRKEVLLLVIGHQLLWEGGNQDLLNVYLLTPLLKQPLVHVGVGPGRMFARRAPGACPARYLCIKYLISSPRSILPLGSPK